MRDIRQYIPRAQLEQEAYDKGFKVGAFTMAAVLAAVAVILLMIFVAR